MSAKTEAIAGINDLSAQAIANLADGSLDGETAAPFYVGIRDSYVEALEDLDGDESEVDDDRMHEIADGAPSVYTHNAMREALDTGAWAREVESPPDVPTMANLAAVALYELARDVLTALAERYEELLSEHDGDN